MPVTALCPQSQHKELRPSKPLAWGPRHLSLSLNSEEGLEGAPPRTCHSSLAHSHKVLAFDLPWKLPPAQLPSLQMATSLASSSLGWSEGTPGTGHVGRTQLSSVLSPAEVLPPQARLPLSFRQSTARLASSAGVSLPWWRDATTPV